MYSRGITRTCKMAETGGERTSKKSYGVTQAVHGLEHSASTRQTYSYIETKKQTGSSSHHTITSSPDR